MVGFPEQIAIEQIAIGECYHPGAISKVIAIEPNGKQHLINQFNPKPLHQDSRLLHIFLEEKLFNKKNAHISVIVSDNLGQFIDQKPVPILVEDIHLSYPFIFPYLGEYYMLTESSESRELTLYSAESFPLKWKNP